MQRAEMVQRGAAQLFIAENAVETALCEVAVLANNIGRMRMDSRLSAVVGQEVIDDIADLYKRLSRARGVAVKLHKSLDGVKKQIGCGAIMVGDDNGKPHPVQTGRVVHVVGDKGNAA